MVPDWRSCTGEVGGRASRRGGSQPGSHVKKYTGSAHSEENAREKARPQARRKIEKDWSRVGLLHCGPGEIREWWWWGSQERVSFGILTSQGLQPHGHIVWGEKGANENRMLF